MNIFKTMSRVKDDLKKCKKILIFWVINKIKQRIKRKEANHIKIYSYVLN